VVISGFLNIYIRVFDAPLLRDRGWHWQCLEAARLARLFHGEMRAREEPDLTIATKAGIVSIELTELLPLASGGAFSSPLSASRR
jgi:hypothetical protein